MPPPHVPSTRDLAFAAMALLAFAIVLYELYRELTAPFDDLDGLDGG